LVPLVSNFVNPDYNGAKFVVVNAIFLSLATVAVILRVYARGVLLRLLGLDDCKLADKIILYFIYSRLADFMILALVRSRPSKPEAEMMAHQEAEGLHVLLNI